MSKIDRPILHSKTLEQVNNTIKKQSHAVVIVGPLGSARQYIARKIASALLGLAGEKLENSQNWHMTDYDPSTPYGVENVKSVRHFFTLRSSTKAKTDVSKIALINNADKLSLDGQNSLLKILEEPPAGSLIILTATSQHGLLPTVVSRCQMLTVHKPERNETVKWLNECFPDKRVDQALDIVDGWPEAAAALLDNSTTEHPLVGAVSRSRDLLTKTTFERLAMVDKMSKQREDAINVCKILQRMAHAALANSATNASASEKWAKIESAAFECETELSQSVNVKLSLTALMLSL